MHVDVCSVVLLLNKSFANYTEFQTINLLEEGPFETSNLGSSIEIKWQKKNVIDWASLPSSLLNHGKVRLNINVKRFLEKEVLILYILSLKHAEFRDDDLCRNC